MSDFIVEDMTCGHCASTITKAVKEVDGEARCEIDLGAKRVRVTSGKPAAEFLEAIQEAGYTPRVAAA
jgi:copper chaperone